MKNSEGFQEILRSADIKDFKDMELVINYMQKIKNGKMMIQAAKTLVKMVLKNIITHIPQNMFLKYIKPENIIVNVTEDEELALVQQIKMNEIKQKVPNLIVTVSRNLLLNLIGVNIENLFDIIKNFESTDQFKGKSQEVSDDTIYQQFTQKLQNLNPTTNITNLTEIIDDNTTNNHNDDRQDIIQMAEIAPDQHNIIQNNATFENEIGTYINTKNVIKPQNITDDELSTDTSSEYSDHIAVIVDETLVQENNDGSDSFQHEFEEVESVQSVQSTSRKRRNTDSELLNQSPVKKSKSLSEHGDYDVPTNDHFDDVVNIPLINSSDISAQLLETIEVTEPSFSTIEDVTFNSGADNLREYFSTIRDSNDATIDYFETLKEEQNKEKDKLVQQLQQLSDLVLQPTTSAIPDNVKIPASLQF